MSWRVLLADLIGETEVRPVRNRADRMVEVERVDRLARDRFRTALARREGDR